MTGGFDLGFERAGFEVSWQVEIDPWCRKVLANNFPRAERYADIRDCGAINSGNREQLEWVDVICGGFPCQDISNAGRKAGIDGDRSGLWSEQLRIIRELRPKFAFIENVSALVGFGLERVLSDLASIGFDAEWEVVSAGQLGANNLRKRVWILANPMRQGREGRFSRESVPESTQKTFSEHSYTSFGDWQGLDNFAAGLPEKHGLSVGLVRQCIHGLGNAVVPQIPEMYARRIKELL